jgi:uncharacterized protein YjbI with pentapeptide repeats
MGMDTEHYRLRVNQVLKRLCSSSAFVPTGESKDYFGKNFKGANLDGRDFSMALMIAANLERCGLQGTNFLGADLRDTEIKNTDLSGSLFLTQMQINAARGNAGTILPPGLDRPVNWQT